MQMMPEVVDLQQQAVDNGQVQFTDGAGLVIQGTLGIDLSAVADVPAPAPLPAGLDNAGYHGAVDPAAATGWWDGWTYRAAGIEGNLPGADFHPLEAEITTGTIAAAAMNACDTLTGGAMVTYANGGVVTIYGQSFPVCVVSGRITEDATWPNSHVFVMNGTINVGDGDAQGGPSGGSDATLTIQAGTQVFAAEESRTSLVITRGSQIAANGTADAPIIIGAVAVDLNATDVITGDPTDLTGRGNWGGVVLSGAGQNSAADNPGQEELLTEAAPDGEERYFGGSSNAGTAGTMRYTIIAESGFTFREGQEVQGLTVEAAGSNTVVEYLQVIGSEDDGIEWFGGAGTYKWLVVQGQDDDALDQDEGFIGTIQFAIVVMGSTEGDRGIESDGKFADQPFTAPLMSNVTIIGDVGKESAQTFAALHRENWQGQVWRSVYTDGDANIGGVFDSGCLDIDDELDDDLAYADGIFNCASGVNGGLVDDDDS